MHPILPNGIRRTSYDHTQPLRRVEEDHIPTTFHRRLDDTPIESYQSVADDTDSWFEIPSDRIITTGLQVRSVTPKSVSNSSQDEYEESESESDRVLSSSNEELDMNPSTGVINTFTPQPNVFSQPTDTFTTRPRLSERLPSNRMITQRTIRQPDHDAALRASLTTLLSCAAAVRPKERERPTTTQTSVQPTTLRLVSESQMMKPTKRRSREPSKERHAKKLKALRAEEEAAAVASTAMTTWMISAGVVLVFSAISFSAGYAWGKEVGKFEGVGCGNCGREAIKTSEGLRKLRWTTSQNVSV